MRHYTFIVFLGGVLFFLVNWECEQVLSRGGRGGGGSRRSYRSDSGRYSESRTFYRGGGRVSRRRSNTRAVGSRSGVTRAFRSSRAIIASRYSYTWKTRATSRGYIYIHHNHSSSTYYTSESNVYDWSVCFNLIFSGENNTPIVPIDSHEQMRTLDDSVYEMAVNHLVNITLQHGMGDSDFKNFSRDLELANENGMNESIGNNSWQYVGLFACPMFFPPSTEKQESDCCGPEDAEYCCVIEVAAYTGALVASIIGLSLLIAFTIYKKGDAIYWCIMGCFGHHKSPRMTPVVLTPEDHKVGDRTQPEQVPLNTRTYPYNEGGGGVILAPLPPLDQPVAMGDDGGPPIGFDGYSGNQNGAAPPGSCYYPPAPQPDVAPPTYEAASANSNSYSQPTI